MTAVRGNALGLFEQRPGKFGEKTFKSPHTKPVPVAGLHPAPGPGEEVIRMDSFNVYQWIVSALDIIWIQD